MVQSTRNSRVPGFLALQCVFLAAPVPSGQCGHSMHPASDREFRVRGQYYRLEICSVLGGLEAMCCPRPRPNQVTSEEGRSQEGGSKEETSHMPVGV